MMNRQIKCVYMQQCWHLLRVMSKVMMVKTFHHSLRTDGVLALTLLVVMMGKVKALR